jgi:hypothetical protein
VGIALRSLHLLLNPPDDAVVVVIRVYFDNSGTQEDPQHKVLTLGGYACNEAQWARFESAWAANLAKWNLPYLHMKQFAHFVSPSHIFKDNEPERIKFIAGCAKAIKDSHPKSLCHSIRLADVARFNKEYGRKIDAISFCLFMHYIEIRAAYGDNNRVEVIIDKIEKPHLRLAKAEEYAKTDTMYSHVADTIDARPLKAPDSFINILPMQAADFLVWELRKSTENLDKWFATRKPGLSPQDWYRDLADWNMKKFGAPIKERKSLLALHDAVPNEGFAFDYSVLELAEKHHPNGWGDLS